VKSDVVAVKDALDPFNPANQYNPGVPFGPLGGLGKPEEMTGSRNRKSR
jgi:hypothetical protein